MITANQFKLINELAPHNGERVTVGEWLKEALKRAGCNTGEFHALLRKGLVSVSVGSIAEQGVLTLSSEALALSRLRQL